MENLTDHVSELVHDFKSGMVLHDGKARSCSTVSRRVDHDQLKEYESLRSIEVISGAHHFDEAQTRFANERFCS